MYKWCESCNEAVEPRRTTDYARYGEFTKEEIVLTCPYCGRELYDDAVKCGCGEYMKEGEDMCETCSSEIDETLEEIEEWLRNRGHENPIELIGERLDKWD